MVPRNRIVQPFLDAWIRRKARLHETSLDRYKVRIARTLEEYEDAFALVHVAYAYIGIENVARERYRITSQHVLPEATVLVVYEGNQLVGTMTVTLDSPAGLPLEGDYPDEVAALRSHERRLVEFGSLAVVKRCYHTGVATLLSMAAVYWSINVLKATDCVIGVHPKAEPFYRALYTFSTVGPAIRHNELAAPVLGMHMRFDEIIPHLQRKFRVPCTSGVLPYEYYSKRLPECIELPTHLSQEELVRWKLPREVFQSLFIQKTNRVSTLDDKTKCHLEEKRTKGTLFNKPLAVNMPVKVA